MVRGRNAPPPPRQKNFALKYTKRVDWSFVTCNPAPDIDNTGATMNILSRLTHRIRAITGLKRRQRAAHNRRMARSGVMATRTRPPVPAFLRRAA